MPKIDSQKGAVKISTFAGMAIIAAVVVVASTIAVIKYRETPRAVAPVAVITPKLTPSVTPTPTSVIDSGIENWQTYKNEKYGFEVKYPLGFEEQKSESDTILLATAKTDRGSSYFLNMYAKPNYKVDRIISSIADTEKIIIGSYSGYKYFYVEGAGMSEVALIQMGQDVLSIGFDSIDSGQSFATANDRKVYVQDLFDQILSTFKFTK